MSDVAKPPEPVKQPLNRLPGTKIQDSPYRDAIATFLLAKKGYAHCLRYLDGQDYHCDIATVKEFEANFVTKLELPAREALLRKAQEDEDKRNRAIIHNATHARMSRVESLILLIAKTEEQAEAIESKGEKAVSWDREFHGKCLDRIRYFREQLERARIESEVEKMRRDSVEAVSNIALEFLKEDPDAAQRFMQQVADFLDRAGPA